MGYKDITQEQKNAKPIAARFIQAKSGTMGIEVAFRFEEQNGPEQLTWVGWLSSKALENTMRTLVEVLGFNGDESTDAAGNLINKEALNWNQDVSIVVEFETNPESGKSYPKIKWVNKLGGSGFASCSPEAIKVKLAETGFKAAFLAARQSTSATVQNTKMQTLAQAEMHEQDLPF